MASTENKIDLVVFGATGFTGTEVCVALARNVLPGVRWAIAGRNQAKLEKVHDHCSKVVGDSMQSINLPSAIVLADVNDEPSLYRMAKQARIVLNCTGPYRFFGEQCVSACIAARCHCLDLCGEPEFYDRILLKYHEQAKDAGVWIVHAAAWDSVPADIGVLLAAKSSIASGGVPADYVEVCHQFHNLSCGHVTTYEAAVHGVGASLGGGLAALRKQVESKYPSYKPKTKGDAVSRNYRSCIVNWHSGLNGYMLKFPGSDASVVRYSQRSLSKHSPGLCPKVGVFVVISSFKYLVLILLLGCVFGFLAQFKWGRKLLLKYPRFFTLGFFTQEGPSPQELLNGSFETHVEAFKLSDSGGLVSSSKVIISGPEPGYIATPYLFLAMTHLVLNHAALLRGGRGDKNSEESDHHLNKAKGKRESDSAGGKGGCYTPAGLIGEGKALEALVQQILSFKRATFSISVSP